MSDETPSLPAHIEATIHAIARLQDRHRRSATPLQFWVDRLAAVIGRATFVGALTTMIVAWVLGNIVAKQFHLRPLDAPPFNWLQTATSVLALYITVLILAAQRRENELSELRAHLSLQLVITSEKKVAKIIQLLEELRRDLPHVQDRIDEDATVMAQHVDPEVMLRAIQETQDSIARMPTITPDA